MSAQPAEPPHGHPELDRRVTDLEHYQGHVLPYDLAAMRLILGAAHAEVQAVRAGVTRIGQRQDQMAAELSTVARSQIEHGAALAGLAATVERHGTVLDGHTVTLAGHGAMLKAQGQVLAEHTDALTSLTGMVRQILDRLPDPGESGT